ncbi:hypothetical protein GOODEAATRI_022397 [Goodea atripinnis]|uniref:Uncharacterized protein n=1 Tax=Goodea atripinnis TaxID=208336 RepID=A0ABV0NCS2_9TELE
MQQNLTALRIKVRDILLNLTLTSLVPKFYLLNAEGFKLWFQVYLPLLLPSADSKTFEIIPRNITCSSYQEIVKGFDNIISRLSGEQNQLVFKFALDYLKGQLSSGLSCVESGSVTDDRRWLEVNFRQFRFQASFKDFLAFNINFKGVKIRSTNYTQEIKSAFLQAVFGRGGLTAVSDEELLLWLKVRLRPLLIDLSPSFVTSVASIGEERRCPTLLKCFDGRSFYLFLKNSFLSFGFPDVSTFISLLPPTRKSELLNSFNTSELRQFLSEPGAIRNGSDICYIFSIYNNTAAFLETEDVPDDVKRIILPCVWPLALSSDRRSEVNFWFDRQLRNYFQFLTKDLISSTAVQNASCLAFEKLVSFLGKNFTYNTSEFGREDVYSTIRSYLRAGSGAKCYNSSDPELNSTSWFSNYIGSFVMFITLDDLTSFVSTSQVFMSGFWNITVL